MSNQNNNNEANLEEEEAPGQKVARAPHLYCFMSINPPTKKQVQIAKDVDIELFWNEHVGKLAEDQFNEDFDKEIEDLDAEHEFDGIVAWHPMTALVGADLSMPVAVYNMRKSRIKVIRL